MIVGSMAKMSSPAAKKSRFSPVSTVQLPSQPLPPAAALGQGISSPPGTCGSGSNDQVVQSAVMRYLQKRRYSPSMTDAFQKLQQSSATQNKAQFAMRELLRSEASSVASLALAAPPNVDPLATEQQYAKFKMWIQESQDSYKPELAQLLYPIFTHFYLDLVLAGHKLIAQKFHKRHLVSVPSISHRWHAAASANISIFSRTLFLSIQALQASFVASPTS